MKMKHIAIPLGLLWVALMVVIGAGYEDSPVVFVIGALMGILIVLLIIAFFRESKGIKARQIQREKDTINKSVTENKFGVLVKNSKYIFIGTVLIILVSPFIQDTYWGFSFVYLLLLANVLVTFSSITKTFQGNKTIKWNIIISIFLLIALVVITALYFPDQMNSYADSR